MPVISTTAVRELYQGLLGSLKGRGNIWFVDSTAPGASDSAGATGGDPNYPFATLAGAIANTQLAAGDVIIIEEGHTESVSASDLILSVANVRIVGQGKGAYRPTFTLAATGSTISITGAGVTLENILVAPGVDSVVSAFTISAADVTLKDIEIRDTTDIECIAGVTTTSAADRLTIDNLFYNGYTGGDACVNGLLLVGVDGAVIKNCRFDGLFSTAAIEFKTTACTKILVDSCSFLNTGTAVTKDIVDTQGSSTWRAVNCFDAVAGYDCAGGNGQAFRYAGGGVLYATKTTTSPLPNNTNTNLFLVVGLVAIHDLAARVSTVIQAQSTGVKFQWQGSTDTAATDMCALLDINGFVVDSVIRAPRDSASAIIGATDVSFIDAPSNTANVAQTQLVYGDAATSAIKLHSAAASTGALQAWCIWEPLSPGARLYAA